MLSMGALRFTWLIHPSTRNKHRHIGTLRILDAARNNSRGCAPTLVTLTCTRLGLRSNEFPILEEGLSENSKHNLRLGEAEVSLIVPT